MSVLELGAVEEKVITNGTIENLTDYWGTAEDHNIFEVSLVKGYKYIFDIQSTSIYRNSFGIDQYNDVNIKITDPTRWWSYMNERDGLVTETTLAGITTISFIAQETGTYKLDVWGKAGYDKTNEFGEFTRIDTPYVLTAIDMGQIDIYANVVEEAFEITFDKTNADGFAYSEIQASSYSSIDDQDWFRFTPDSTKEYIVTVTTTDGNYKRIDIDLGWERWHDIGAGKSNKYNEQWFLAPSNNDEILLNVTGSKGDYILKIEESDFDIGGNTATADMETLSLDTIYETSQYNYWDRDYFKLDNLVAGDTYEITIDSDYFNGSSHSYTIRTSNTPDTQDSESRNPNDWGNMYGSVGYGYRYADGNKFYFVASDTNEFYFYFKDLLYDNNFGAGVLDYNIRVEKVINELASSIEEIIADENRVVLEEDVVFTQTGLATKHDFVAVNLDKAGTYIFNYNYDSTASIFENEIVLHQVTGIGTKSTNQSYYNKTPNETASVVAGATISGTIVADETATLSTTDEIPTGFVLNDDGSYSFDTSSYKGMYYLNNEEVTIPIVITDEDGGVDYTNLRFTIFSDTYYSSPTAYASVGTNISGTINFANIDDSATITTSGDTPTGFILSENGDYILDTSSYGDLADGEVQYLRTTLDVTVDDVTTQEEINIKITGKSENFNAVEYSFLDGKLSFTVSDEIGSEATTGLYYLELKSKDGDYDISYTYNEFSDTDTDNIEDESVFADTVVTDLALAKVTLEKAEKAEKVAYIAKLLADDDTQEAADQAYADAQELLADAEVALPEAKEEFDIALEAASTLEIGTTYTHSIGSYDDIDYFKVDLKAGETYKFDTSSPILNGGYRNQLFSTLTDSNDQKIYDQDSISVILKEVFEKVYIVSGEHMQRTLDFFENFDINDFFTYLEKIDSYNGSYLLLLPQEREDFILYYEFFDALDYATFVLDSDNRFDFTLWMEEVDESGSYTFESSLTLDKVDSVLRISSSDGHSLDDFTKESLPPVLDRVAEDLKIYASELKSNLIEERDITQEQLTANLVEVIDTLNTLTQTDFDTMNTELSDLQTLLWNVPYPNNGSSEGEESEGDILNELVGMLESIATDNYSGITLQEYISLEMQIVGNMMYGMPSVADQITSMRYIDATTPITLQWWYQDTPSVEISDGTNTLVIAATEVDTSDGFKISVDLTDFLVDTPITITMSGTNEDWEGNEVPVESSQDVYIISTNKETTIADAISDSADAFDLLDITTIIDSEITAIADLLPDTNPTIEESITALNALNSLKQKLEYELSTPIPFTDDQLQIMTDIRASLSIDNLNAYLTNIVDAYDDSSSGVDLLNAIGDIKFLNNNLHIIFPYDPDSDTTPDYSSVSDKIAEVNSSITALFSVEKLNEVVTYLETLSADSSLSYDDAQTIGSSLSTFKYDILSTYNPDSQEENTEIITYFDNYKADLLSTDTGTSTVSDEINILNTLVEDTYGTNNLYFTQGGSSFVVSEDASYILGMQLNKNPVDEMDMSIDALYMAGEYSFNLQTIDTMDSGDTIEDATSYKEVDSNDGYFDGMIRGLFNSSTDIDMYELEFTSGHRYVINYSHGSWYDSVNIYDQNGDIVQYPIVESRSDTQLEFNPLETQTYYMEINSSIKNAGETYNVDVVDFANSDFISGSLEDAAKYSDVVFDPDVASQSFIMDFTKDKDYYEIDAVSGNYYTIDLTSTDMKFVFLKVFASDGTEVFTDTYYKNSMKLNIEDIEMDYPYLITEWDNDSVAKFTLYAANIDENAGNKYYVEVSNSSETGTYKLDVSLNEIVDDYGSDSATIASFIKNDGKKTAQVDDTLNGKVLEASDITDGFVTVAIGDDFNSSILSNTDITYDNTIEGSFEKRNDKDWFKYDWDKAVYSVVVDSESVDVIDFRFKYQYGTEINDLSEEYVNIVRDYQAERDDDSFTALHYIVAFKYNLDDNIALSLQNTFGAGDYSLSIDKIADIDDAIKFVTLDETTPYTNTADKIQYQTASSKYSLHTQANGAYQIELSADDANRIKLGQLLITITDIRGNTQELLKEWNPDDVMTRAIFIAEDADDYTIEIKTADSSKMGDFTFNIEQLDMAGDVGSSVKNNGDFDSLATDSVVTGTLDISIDKDWYKYDFIADKQYLISLDATAVDSENALVYIYDSEGDIYKDNQIWDTNDALSTSDKTILFNPTEDGEFFLSVSDSAEGDYTLKVEEYTDTTDIVDSALTNATVVVDATQAVTSLIDSKDDRDWIKVTLEVGKIYKVETKASGDKMPIPVDLVINGIYNSSSELIVGTVSNNGVQYIKPASDGDYFIEIAGKNNTLGFYDITVVGDTTTDTVSADSSTNQTMIIGTTYKGEIDYIFDKDWIKISLDAGKKYDISMSGDILHDSHITGIYDASGDSLSLSNNDASNYTLDSMVTLDLTDETGTLDYFIEASGYGDLKGSYKIDVEESTLIDTLLNETDGNDANNSVQTAITGLLGRYQFGKINYETDSDLYKYELKAGVTYEINMFGIDSKLGSLSNSLIKSIKDSDGMEIAGYSNARGGDGNDSLLVFTPDTTGSYYVETASQYHTMGTYKLNLKEAGDEVGNVEGLELGSHTVMVYLGGDNNLEKYMLDDLIEMQLGTLPDNWNVTFLIDRAEGYYTGHGDWTDTRQGIVTFADSSISEDRANSEILSSMGSLGELNTGDGQTLTDFINWSAKMAQASSYSLILSNHGGGTSGSVWDDASSHDNIKIAELTSAIEASSVHQDALLNNDKGFEMIGFDTCLQGVLDQQYALKSVTDVVLASEEVSWSTFWDYEAWFDSISDIYDANNGVVTGADMAGAVVTLMGEHDGHGEDMTYSAVDTELLDEVVSAVAQMNNLLATVTAQEKQLIQVNSQSVVIFTHETQMDLGAFANMLDNLDIGGAGSGLDLAAQDVVTAVSNAVLYNATNMTGNGGDALGIAVQYGYGEDNSDYMENFELASAMNMNYFFEIV